MALPEFIHYNYECAVFILVDHIMHDFSETIIKWMPTVTTNKSTVVMVNGWWCDPCDRVPLQGMGPGGWFNIKMTSYQYRKSHCGDKTILRPSYLHNGISYTGKMSSLYWIRAQKVCEGMVCALTNITCNDSFQNRQTWKDKIELVSSAWKSLALIRN